MRPLTSQNIESELSYAYVHAVAAAVGACVSEATRHEDSAGIDAKLTAWGPFPNGGLLTEVDLKIQLKATIKTPVRHRDQLSYELQGIGRYNDLRAETLATPRILVVLFLPEEQSDWLVLTADSLQLKKCAHWVSLRGAPVTENNRSVTVYLPEQQRFHPDGLRTLFASLSRVDIPRYKEVGDDASSSN